MKGSTELPIRAQIAGLLVRQDEALQETHYAQADRILALIAEQSQGGLDPFYINTLSVLKHLANNKLVDLTEIEAVRWAIHVVERHATQQAKGAAAMTDAKANEIRNLAERHRASALSEWRDALDDALNG